MEMTKFECGHSLCEKGIESSLHGILSDFFMKFNANNSFLYEDYEYSIGCPYDNCFAKYLYSTDKFIQTFRMFFDYYGINETCQKYILNKFDGFKIYRIGR